jgi:hypothetical protein
VLDLLLAVKLVVTLALVASIAAACLAPPPRRCPTSLAAGLALGGLACAIGGLAGVVSGAVLLAAAVEASALALWLLRAPPDDGEDGGGGAPPTDPVDPDAPDPDAFDWDEFERATQSGAPLARR